MGNIELRNPEVLVSAEWLEQNLDDPKLRIFDCSTVLAFEQGRDKPYAVLDCRDEYQNEHIPGSGYLDLQGQFSKSDSRYNMTLPDPETIAAAFGRHGIDDDTKVVLYSRRSMSWSTRFWWMLYWLGFDNAAVLNGGLERWVEDGRPSTSEPCNYDPGSITVKLRPEAFVGKEEVLAAIDNSSVCTINALSPELHSGQNARYGRGGRVPGSINVPQIDLIDGDTFLFRQPEAIAESFKRQGVTKSKETIVYCGGGIFATVDAFWLRQLGHDQISVYDNSLSEWASDTSLPIERD